MSDMKTSTGKGAGRIIPLPTSVSRSARAPQGTQTSAGDLGSMSEHELTNTTRELMRRLDATPWRTRAPGHELWRSTHEMPLRGGAWGVKGADLPRAALAPRIREGRLSAVHICGAAGCSRRAVKPCFDCGEWRCEEHLLAAVHHRKSAVVQLCPTCMHGHVEHPERLRLDGIEDPRAQRAPNPLLGQEAGLSEHQTEVTPLARNTLLDPSAHAVALWRAEEALISPVPAKSVMKPATRRQSALLARE